MNLTKETVNTALIALQGDKLRFEHLLKGTTDSVVKEYYKMTLDRIAKAIAEIKNNGSK